MRDFLTIKKHYFVNGLDSYDKELYQEYFDKETIDNCFKIYNSTKRRKKENLNDLAKWYFAISKIKRYKDYKIIFGTLTFKKEILASTSKETRRRYVTRFLKENKKIEHYIANIDYGKKKNREHYHFIAFSKEKIDNTWPNGYVWFKELKIDKSNLKRTIKYILKLNNHCYKESTKFERIIKDRNKENILDKTIKLLYEEEFKRFKVTEMDMRVSTKKE